MDLGRLPPFQRARQISARGRVRINSAGAPRAGLLPPLLPMLRRASPAGAIPSRSTRRRDGDQERHDWAQWDERTNDRPHRPSPSTAHWRTPLAS
jgi:hypothetical protein